MPARIKQDRPKLVIHAQFDDNGHLQINGRVKKFRNRNDQVELLSILRDMLMDFLKQVSKVQEVVNENQSNSTGSGDEPKGDTVS